MTFRAARVPVGEDPVAHIEMCRAVGRRFNQVYCGVDPATPDAKHTAAGGLFPIPNGLSRRIGQLVGTDGMQKMSKSLGNAIDLTDTTAQVKLRLY